MIKGSFEKRTFHFKNPSGTSRGVLTEKHSWFITLESNGIIGVGECSIIEGLSPDFRDTFSYEKVIQECLNKISEHTLDLSNIDEFLVDYPSILFGFETAFLDLKNGGKGIIFDNSFTSGLTKIPINGLIWMGSKEFMQTQIEEKIAQGFTTIKLKIGIDFPTEITILKELRKEFDSSKITLRVDANGAFKIEEAMEKLEQLAELEIHSIEQPIATGQWNEMHDLCKQSPLPIALDEELIGINILEKKKQLLDTIQPPFIILKPSLHGGIHGCGEWIQLAEERSIKWWMTSALESNIGLNAICQFTAEFKNNLPQGLGTGGLYIDNIDSNLLVKNGIIQLTI